MAPTFSFEDDMQALRRLRLRHDIYAMHCEYREENRILVLGIPPIGIL